MHSRCTATTRAGLGYAFFKDFLAVYDRPSTVKQETRAEKGGFVFSMKRGGEGLQGPNYGGISTKSARIFAHTPRTQ